MRIVFLTSMMVMLNFVAFSQLNGDELLKFINSTNDEKKLVKESVNQSLNGHFDNADLIIDKLLSINSKNVNYLYRKGYVTYYLDNNNKGVIDNMNKAKEGKLSKNFDLFSIKNKGSVDAYYFLGVAYQKNNQLDSAMKYIDLYLDQSKKKSSLYNDAELRLKYLANARKQLEIYNSPDGDKNISILNLGEDVNSKYPDYSSAISPNGLDLFYTSKRPWGGDTSIYYTDPNTGQYTDDIYKSSFSFESNKWGNGTRIPSNTPKYNEGVTSSNGQQNLMYLYNDSLGKGDITMAKINDEGSLGTLQDLDIPNVNEKKYWEPSIFINESYERVYFSSDRKGGYGGLDIYYSDKKSDGTWSNPVNLGSGINTKYNEDAPSLSTDGKYFFYASNNEKSMGGFDIFYAPISAKGEIGNGNPLKYPMNSTSDDIYYKSSKDGFTGFLTSDRPDSHGDLDIYEVKDNYIGLEKVRFLIAALSTNDGEVLPTSAKVRLTCTDCDDKTAKVLEPRQRDGVVQKALEPCHHYTIEYLLNDEVKKENEFTTDCDVAVEHVKMPYIYDLRPVVTEPQPEKTLLVQFKKEFGYNQNKIANSNHDFEDMIAQAKKLLENDTNTRVIFEINSSASKVPTRTFGTNEALAQKRAENCQSSIMNQFDEQQKKSGRVSVEIKEVKVDGPEYDKDFKDKAKYIPFQYVEVKTFKK